MTEELFTVGMNSTLIELKGKVAWCRLLAPNKYDKWSLQLFPDTATLEILRELQGEGIKNVLKKDPVEGYNVQISRPTTIQLRKGLKSPVAPPIVTDGEGNDFDANTIGNGSDAIVVCELYSHPVPNTQLRAKAIRLAKVRVLNNVPYVKVDEQGVPEEPKPKPIW